MSETFGYKWGNWVLYVWRTVLDCGFIYGLMTWANLYDMG